VGGSGSPTFSPASETVPKPPRADDRFKTSQTDRILAE
jgi:hypothetical protein